MATKQDVINYSEGGVTPPPVGLYLPNSDSSKVICECYPDGFIDGNRYWGYGSSPMVFTGDSITHFYDDTTKSVYLKSRTARDTTGIGNDVGIVYTGNFDKSVTVYFVGKLNTSVSYYFIFGANRYSNSNGGSGIRASAGRIMHFQWNTDTYITDSAIAGDWFVAFLRENWDTKQGTGGVLGHNTNTQTLATINKLVMFGSVITEEERCSDLYIRYVGVVLDAESDANIQANMQNLKTEFIDNY